ncbi:hypothetical protein GIB67_041422 [Kingdonia uniflora]|uniref:Uncharacterized protein n=1 Tax=Kingdonia uniflora TaxID=39325 RepID=A0A7J7LRI5_9MAGN|nr:hypothetical protein GIB67_041422 [Kingdonia uniflora]
MVDIKKSNIILNIIRLYLHTKVFIALHSKQSVIEMLLYDAVEYSWDPPAGFDEDDIDCDGDIILKPNKSR